MAASNTTYRSTAHRALRGLLILVSLGCTAAFIHFVSRHGSVQLHGRRLPVSAEMVALAAPIVGLVSLWLAILVENHERTRSLTRAVTQTFARIWWTLAMILLIAAWVWVSNHL